MVNRSLSLAVCVSLAAATAAFAQSSYIFQLPGQAGRTTQIVGLGDNDFQPHRGSRNGPAGATESWPRRTEPSFTSSLRPACTPRMQR